MNQLVRYDAARHALQVAHSVDEVKDIRDKAQAMAAYARLAKDTALVEWATEIKVRAERRAGGMLATLERSNGGRGKTEASVAQVYRDNDIAPTTGKRRQKLAAIPDPQFEKAVAAAKEVAHEVTTAALMRAGSSRKPARRAVEQEQEEAPDSPKDHRSAFLLRAEEASLFAKNCEHLVIAQKYRKELAQVARAVGRAWDALADKLETP